jgi:hypothetical protein
MQGSQQARLDQGVSRGRGNAAAPNLAFYLKSRLLTSEVVVAGCDWFAWLFARAIFCKVRWVAMRMPRRSGEALPRVRRGSDCVDGLTRTRREVPVPVRRDARCPL